MWTKLNREKRKFKEQSSSKSAKNASSEVISIEGQEAVLTPEDEPHSSTSIHPHRSDGDSTRYLPKWFDNYVEYKFNLLDRAGE